MNTANNAKWVQTRSTALMLSCLLMAPAVVNGQDTTILSYDSRHQLVTAVYGGGQSAVHYQYDSSGNRTRRIFVSSDNPTADHNGNGLYDLWELIHFGHLNADPDADPDNDDLTNLEESLHWTDPHNPDTDGDGISDGAEVAADTDPNDPDCYLHITGVEMTQDGFEVRWRGGQAVTQVIEARDCLIDPEAEWTPVHTVHPPTPVSGSHVDGNSVTPRRFYRIVIPQ